MKNMFAIRLSEFIKETGLSKRKFAEKVGVSAVSVSDWTAGKIQPNAESIYLVCKAFNISSDYLLGLTEETQMR
ncbi:MAG: helix-turn-helix transcriptional regulator [Clostridia bacterium]|jgi:transcriptional regulator with XRE-family HTH domain|nr:helix-turn-helix transcriptional regulator [Clostridia bacterium]